MTSRFSVPRFLWHVAYSSSVVPNIRSQHDMVPDYRTAHLLDNTPSRRLRSSEDKQLVVIKTHSHYGDISFQVAAAKLWNAAPFRLKSI